MDTALEILKDTAIVSAVIFGTFAVILLLTETFCELLPGLCGDEEEGNERISMPPWY